MGFFGPLDFVALKAEEAGRMAQHAHGLVYSRFFKLYNIDELMGKDSKLVMSWMGCVATSVMGPRLVSLPEDNYGPLNRICQKYGRKELLVWIIFKNFLSGIGHYFSVLYNRWFTTLTVMRKEMK